VTIGVRSTAAALIAGLSFVMLPALVQAYVPWSWVANLLPVLFGLGAISAAKYPDGVLAENSRRLRRLMLRLRPTTAPQPQLDGAGVLAADAGPVDAAPMVAEHVS
jgi:hypothetical protein